MIGVVLMCYCRFVDENSFGFSIGQREWDIIKLLLKIGAIGTLVSIPIGIWTIKRWPDNPLISAAILTAVGFAVKEVMISRGERVEPLHEELREPGVAAMASNMGAWSPAVPLFFG